MVVSYTQLLAREYRGRLDSPADQFIAYAVEGAQRMETLLRDLREYWSVNEHWNKHPTRTDCNVVFEKAVQHLNPAVQESGAHITHDPLPVIIAEEVLLLLVFQNLVGNAIKYRRPEEPPRIHMWATRQDGVWRLSLSDNGIGIDAQYLDMIFAPFKRLHGADVYPGSGLGLAICKKIIERARGRIWAESSGQGSTFHLTIPVKDGEV